MSVYSLHLFSVISDDEDKSEDNPFPISESESEVGTSVRALSLCVYCVLVADMLVVMAPECNTSPLLFDFP